jgi:methionine biosynthesis protein MetW
VNGYGKMQAGKEGPVPSENGRVDFVVIRRMVGDGARVLDVGCGDGTLLRMLTESRHIEGRGIEIRQENVNRCVASGLSVIQGDANVDLRDYPDGAFDFVVLSQTVQAMREPREVIEQLVRIGRRAIVSFPNFGHWRVRAYLALLGRMPVTGALPDTWFDTPNIHLCTIRDFAELCGALEVTVERAVALDRNGRQLNLATNLWSANLIGEQAVFLLSRAVTRTRPHAASPEPDQDPA